VYDFDRGRCVVRRERSRAGVGFGPLGGETVTFFDRLAGGAGGGTSSTLHMML